MRNSHACTVAPRGLPQRVWASCGGDRSRVKRDVSAHEQRMVQSAMQDLFGVEMSFVSVNNLRQEASDAVADPVAAAVKYVQQQPVVGADETSLARSNADGHNPNDRTAWLWVIVTPLVTCFQVILSRGQEAAQTVLGLDESRHSHLRPPRGIQLGGSLSQTAMLGAPKRETSPKLQSALEFLKSWVRRCWSNKSSCLICGIN
jgi:hypothetical protein